MKINITKKQFLTLVEALETSVFPLEILHDSVMNKDEAKKYGEKATAIRGLQSYFYEYAKDFGCENFFERDDFDNKVHLKDKYLDDFGGMTMIEYERCLFDEENKIPEKTVLEI